MSPEQRNDLDAAMRERLEQELVAAGMRARTVSQAPAQAPPSPGAVDAPPLGLRQAIADIASTVLKIPLERLDMRAGMSRYGVDSIIVTEIMKRVSDLFGLPIAPTVFFEARHLEELADILHRRYATTAAPRRATVDIAPPAGVASDIDDDVQRWIARFRTMAADAPRPRGNAGRDYEPVAIIAMDGRFAESADLHEFERHLRDGDDCIREVPPDRWDWRAVFGDPQQGEFTQVKFGGFAPDIDKFDPLFFGMSPREAELMDPQHRLFIECVWKLIEAAGYSPGSLAGRKVGMFIGINLQDYAHLVDRAGAMEALHLTSLGHMFCPNRLSFLLDIHGPSQVIDTACSSSLVALHRAVLSIQHEGCEMAIAGGANLMISPDMHIMYSKVGMICADGRCKTFSSQANGYVRGDGVGAVLLKSLAQAERDGDTILAVIRGSAENHGGMSTSLTAPNPRAQASLIVEAYRRAAIDPRSVGYIECHGTGTALGDPIEVNGLKMAFEELHREAGLAAPEAPYCGLGSVKSNIGHAETAAGIAGVVKAVLAIRSARLYPSLHCDDLNPMIELERSPFFILQQGRAWPRAIIDGQEQPRRAGVSSFGAGGSNAHVLIEEYAGPPLLAMPASAPALVLLSARNAGRLRDLVARMHRYLEDTPAAQWPELADFAYTLQVGRDAMTERLALVVDSLAELQEKLGRIAQAGEADSDGCTYTGTVKRGKTMPLAADRHDGGVALTVQCGLAEGNLRSLAELWTGGADIDWAALHASAPQASPASRRPRRVSLPTYPFARQRCWLPHAAAAPGERRGGAVATPLHPLVQTNTSDLAGQRFSSVFTGRESFLADHVMMGDRLLPAVVYLEMARAASKLAGNEADRVGVRLKNVVWARPLAVGEDPVTVHIGLHPDGAGQVAYRIYSMPAAADAEPVLHSQGTIVPAAAAGATAALDLAALRERITGGQSQRRCLDARQCYAAFAAMGMAYGPAQRCLDTVWFSAATPEVLARLCLEAATDPAATPFVLHPGLMDAALQACIGLLAGTGQALPGVASADAPPATAALPFALEEFELVAPLAATMWAWIRYANGSVPSDPLQKLDIDLCDDHGRVCVRLRGFCSRAAGPAPAAEADALLMCRPVWIERPVVAADGPVWSMRHVVLCDLDGCLAASIEQEIAANLAGTACSRLRLQGAVEDWYTQASMGVFDAVKAALARTDGGRALVQVVVPRHGDGVLLSGLCGLLNTANRESTRVFAQLIELDGDDDGRHLAGMLLADGRDAVHAHIRHAADTCQVLQWQETDGTTPAPAVPWKDHGVYLITGGAGGLGLKFAGQVARHARDATVILCGRSAAAAHAAAQFDAWSAGGLRVEYRQADVSQRAQVEALVDDIVRRFGRLDGVMHCAGVLADNFIARKTAQEFAAVLAPKVDGSVHLDCATAALGLDFFALFASAAGALGSAGQADYAAANAFMDAFAQHRDARVRRGQRHGRSLAVDWPLWAAGGMRMQASAQAMMQRSTGMQALPDAAAMCAFERIVAAGAAQTLVLYGSPAQLRRWLAGQDHAAQAGERRRTEDAHAATVDGAVLRERIEQALLRSVATLMKFEPDDLDADTEWNDCGFDSITLTDFSNRLNREYRLELTPTVFFEYPTIAALAAGLASDHAEALAKALDLDVQAPRAVEPALPGLAAEDGEAARLSVAAADNDDAVAIIGMSGRFPMARDLEAFWTNLLAGTDCISEIPPDRWDWKALYGDPATAANRTDIKWGGFIDGVGDFDAHFFGISPREAELMDPQQRLLMQYVWKAIEDAGYSAASLSGSQTALFVGTAPSGYGELVAQSGSAIDRHSSTGSVGSIGPNRMSYFLNLHGPSEPIETACSSSLVAVHRALSAMANGDCDQAIVGGINLIVSPQTHISFNKAGMLCADGRCKTFSRQANGYVRGEGVGMLFLKKLKAAEQAGDRIYAVIRGSAENHGGRGNSLTAPSPQAQAAVIKAAYTRARVDPRTVGYIEAHGTGTALGDPIEVDGLKAGFRELYRSSGTPDIAGAHCGLGSVKTNIGHLELAAGVAGVIKVVLQLRHRTLVRSLHCDEVNPYMQLQDSPFYLLHQNREWAPLYDDQGRELPRRAGVSSFGFGGVNAHVVIEEYPQAPSSTGAGATADDEGLPRLVVLSAKTPERLRAYAHELLALVGAAAADPARQTLLERTCAVVADLLQVGRSEIEPGQPLEEYGIDPAQRMQLRERLQQALGQDLAATAFLQGDCIDALVTSLLESHAGLRQRLPGEAVDGAAPDISLAELAYTLQVGRDAMGERLALVAHSIGELAGQLRAFVEDRADADGGIHVGRAKANKGMVAAFGTDEELREALDQWIRRGKFTRLAELWVKGLHLDWHRLYGASGPYRSTPRRMRAPGYPFAERRYWVEARPAAAPERAGASAMRHPLLHENVCTLQQARFRTALSGTEFFLADRRMQGQRVLPGVAYLEMARAAAGQAMADVPVAPVLRLQDVVWIRPAIVDQPRCLHVVLLPEGPDGMRFEVSSETDGEAPADAEPQLHSQGRISFHTGEHPARLDVAAMLARTGMQRFDAGTCYGMFRTAGLDYGPAHQAIHELHAGAGQVLARLVLPASVAHTLDQYVLHPSLMDAALQASIGMVLDDVAASSPHPPTLALPFAVESVDVYGACTGTMWAWVRRPAAVAAGSRVQKLDIDLCDDDGRVRVRIKGFSSRLLDATAPRHGTTPTPAPPAAAPVDADALRDRTIAYFKEQLALVLKSPPEEIRADEALDSYGIDSMMVMDLTGVLEKPFGELSKTLFFEYQTLAELVDHFLDAHRPQLLELFGFGRPALPAAVSAPSPAAVSAPRAAPAARAMVTTAADATALDIAVIGLSGRYPQSRDIEEFWRNLRDGRDCITEVPPDRWDWHAYYSEDRSRPLGHDCKWGGFIADADKFDPLFFNISPSAAEYMDPQERLFLEHAWMAMEDAGYRREDLQKPLRGVAGEDDLPAQVGVYAGVMYGEYQLLGLEASLAGKGVPLTNFYASVANRVSYVLNLHGPSLAVDTMCSSSLTAIHLACQDLKFGRTDLALAGGVNLNLHPNKYSLLSLGQFISSSGKCESFGAGGDGYVPGEGVGVVMLKRLADAERDGDRIYGVIKGSALNHGGKTNGYSVPNPKAQQMAIRRAVREARIDPRAIGYIEAHGTGTRLGDPIEMAGLTRAFAGLGTAGQACWIGSSKSNIGHCEAAAGIAGLTKVLLQMREGRIAPSLHSQALNPNIDFQATPFRVNQQLREWPQPLLDGRRHARAAGVSSFGAGGANAHLIVEEYPVATAGDAAQAGAAAERPCAIVLSARTAEQLGEYAENLLQFVRERHGQGRGALSLCNLAFTLQLGREAMPQRLAFMANSLGDLAGTLQRFLAGDHAAVHAGRARPGGESPPATSAALIAEGRHQQLLAAWVEGAGVDWRLWHAGDDSPPMRISLPTYPFARERYWVAAAAADGTSAPAHEPAAGLLLLQPVWREQAPGAGPTPAAHAEHHLLSTVPLPGMAGIIQQVLPSTAGTADGSFTDHAVALFGQIQDILQRRPAAPVLLQVVTIAERQGPGCPDALVAALVAMLKTARMENPQCIGQLIELEAAATAEPAALADLLRDNAQAPAEPHVRYRQGRREVLAWEEGQTPPLPALPVWRQGGVYLITGGAGGLGMVFAREIASQVDDVSLILAGRSALDDARRAGLEALRALGARVEYRVADVSDPVAAQTLLESIEREGRAAGRAPLNGIIHAAGLIRDNFIIRKTVAELREVLAAKVSGMVNLDLASRGLDLDFFVAFSSLAGAVGNPGQSDYATANAFLDAYAAHRNRLAAGRVAESAAALPRPQGHTLSMVWPLWQGGGMDIDARSKDEMWRTTGLQPLAVEAGIEAFHRALASGAGRIMVLQGDAGRLRTWFAPPRAAAVAAPGEVSMAPAPAPGDATQALAGKVEGLVSKLISDMLKLPLHRIEVDVPLEQYGIDSVAMMKLTGDLEKIVGPLSKTLFFDYPTVQAISAYLAGAFATPLAGMFEPEPVAALAESAVEPAVAAVAPAEDAVASGVHDIAVIGMSGRFPQARDVEAFWQNLAQGRDCVTEVPVARWDHSAYFDPDRSKAGTSYCKWGGFLDDVDRFDARFFRISPGEAQLLDPQERLFLETVWNLLESSGYLGETLRRLCQSRVGVFVGSMSQQYHAFESDLLRESVVALSSPSSIANRASYFFDFQGPSLAIDTMCSSALVAVHMACESLLKGECKVAIAGGVNLSIHPKKYIALSAAQMIGSHPHSTSFGDGDGYLPAEAVGAVLLKPLGQAIADNDTILAVIKSTAINHGGQSNGYRVPNGSAQADLIAGNFARAGIDPRTVSYVESAANGSPLGDAIELGALSAGFRRYTAESQFCAIGSVKSNIGHAEAASGMSQLIKVLLQLQHGQLAPTIKAEPLNPNIDFGPTPFYLQRRLEPWRRPLLSMSDGAPRECPRRATVSSFGAGGSNAHLIVEEYAPAVPPAAPSASAPERQLIVLSARTAAQLDAVVRRLLAFVEQQPALPIADLAYTLQTARETMDHRLAVLAEDRDHLIGVLRDWLRREAGAAPPAGVCAGTVDEDSTAIRQLLSGRTGQATLELLLAERDVDKLAVYWAKGVRITWQPMYHGRMPRRVALPTYPFDGQSHWLADAAAPRATEPFAIDAQQSLRQNVERYLAHSVAMLLGMPADAVDANASLLDYGVDSIVATRLRWGLEQVFRTSVSARDVIEHPTLASLAACIAGRDIVASPADAGAALAVAETETELPLSAGQEGLWLLHQLAPGMSAYNVPVALRFDGRLDIDLLRRACAHVLRRFPVLGSLFASHDGEPCQRIPAQASLHFEHEAGDGLDETGIVERLRSLAKQPFDLERGPLLRVHAIAPVHGAASHVLIVVHHIVFDGRSAALLTQALIDAYRGLLAGREPSMPPEPASYSDFIAWQRQFMASAQARAQLDYWKAQLSGDLPVLSLPCDHLRPIRPGFHGASHETVVAAELAQAVKALARSLQVNASVVFLGVLQLMLYRYSGDGDIVVGMPTLGRPQSRFEATVGYFVNMIAIRGRLSAPLAMADFLKQLQLTVADGLDHADYPFPELLKALRIDRDPARSPLFQVMFAWQSFMPPDATDDARDPDQALPPVQVVPGIHQEGSHDLALEVYPGAENFRLKFDYDTDLFEPATIARAMQHYLRLLASVAAHPHEPVSAHALLSPQEQQQILVDWNANDIACDDGCSIVELFQRQARRTPEQAALRCAGESLSYRELDRQSSRLALHLRELGVADGDAVGVCMQRGLPVFVAMLAVFKTGAVYVPIAPDHPQQRMRDQLEDSRVKQVLTDAATHERVAATGAACLALDAWPPAGSSMDADPAWPIRADGAAYVIYTSGSTGRPKGVAIAHRAISRHCQVMRDYYQLTPRDIVLQFAPLHVDASLEQVLPGLLCGATVVVRPDEAWSAHAFRGAVAAHRISVIDVPPSYLHEVLLDARDTADAATLDSLRLAITGGEALLPETVDLWRDSPLRERRLVNAYGPTEATITSIVFEAATDAAMANAVGGVPIGRPLPGHCACILDACSQPVPVGVAGELHIGGAGLAMGYLGQPEATRQAFIGHPLRPGSTLYRTGDRACWRADGAIAFLGRLDHQVKLRGLRIECGEVEAALRQLPSVRQAAVVSRPVNGGPQLVAFVVRAPAAGADDEGECRRALSAMLPDYMIPAVFVALAELPMTPGGKLDRRALMRHEPVAAQADGMVEPRTPLETQLAVIWRQVLGVARIGVFDNFFDLGGHSLLAVRLMALIRRQLGRDLPLSTLFEAPHIAAQAQWLQTGGRAGSPLVCLQPQGELAPWFCVHAVSGQVLAYRELARQLGERRPLYALQAPDADSGMHAGTIEGLAALYVGAIREVQPHGPYRLGGWSMGGVIACEMAVQLQRCGESVASLALIDSFTPDVVKAFERDHGAQDNDETGMLEAFDRHVPARYHGNAMLFAADAMDAAWRERQRDAWSRLIDGRLTVVNVPGDHYSILRQPAVRALSAALIRSLDEPAP